MAGMLWGLLHPQSNKVNDPAHVPAKRFENTHTGDDLRRRFLRKMAKNLADLTGARAPKNGNGHHSKTKGLRFGRFFTPPGSHAYDLVEWERRTAAITGEKGQVIFEQKDVEVPRSWSQLAINVVAQKYFRGGLGTPERETSVKQLINRVSVDAAFFKKLSPMENLLYAGRLYGLRSDETQLRGLEVLDKLGISRKVAFNPMEDMSRGMQQKVAIARALLTSPVLLLLDEPTTGLDPRSKKDVQRMVLSLREEQDTTVVLTTHDMDEADRLCDRLAVLDRGRVIALDTPDHLKQAGGSMEDVFMRLTTDEEEAA